MDGTGCIFIWGFPLFQGISWVYVKNSLGSYAGKCLFCRWCMGSGCIGCTCYVGSMRCQGYVGSKGCCNVGYVDSISCSWRINRKYIILLRKLPSNTTRPTLSAKMSLYSSYLVFKRFILIPLLSQIILKALHVTWKQNPLFSYLQCIDDLRRVNKMPTLKNNIVHFRGTKGVLHKQAKIFTIFNSESIL